MGQYLINSNKLDTSIHQQFTNNMVAPPIFTKILGDTLSDISLWDIYTRFRMNLVSDTGNIPAPQFIDLGISTIDSLDKSASLCNPAIIVGSPTNSAHRSAKYYIFGINTAVRGAVSAKSDYRYKNNFDIWRENQDFERQKNARSPIPLDSDPVGE